MYSSENKHFSTFLTQNRKVLYYNILTKAFQNIIQLIPNKKTIKKQLNTAKDGGAAGEVCGDDGITGRR